ncbi:MAG: S8 family serine peptidase [Actinomycetota bacterium]
MEFESPRFIGNPVLEEILNDPDTGTKKLQKGSDPDAVRAVQQALFDLGWSLRMDPPVASAEEFVDGDYGPATGRAVLAYKTHYNLRFPPDDPNGFVDEFAGPRTLRKLDPQCVLLDEANAAIDTKVAELSVVGVDVSPTGATTIFDNSPGAVRPATIAQTNGGIFYKRGIGAFEVHGAIFASYQAEHGSAEGPLGYPVTDEVDNPEVTGGRMSEFENGVLFWDPASGVTTEPVATETVRQVMVKVVDTIPLGIEPGGAVTPGEMASLVGSNEGAAVAQALEALAPGLALRPIFELAGTPELDAMIAQAKEQDPEYSPPNFSNFLSIDCPDEVDPEAIATALRQWDGVVEFAYEELVASDPAVVGTTNPRFAGQGYLAAAPGGVGVQSAWAKGVDGSGTGFIDLEQGWSLDHEDLPPGIQLLSGDIRPTSRFHGTGVLGVVAGVDNTLGVAGIAPQTFARVISYFRKGSTTFNTQKDRQQIANTIMNATPALRFGDVLLLEVQLATRLNGRLRFAPVEISPVVATAIQLATKVGVIVIEAAGNGRSNIDDMTDPAGKRTLARGHADFKDTGAIMVGGCTSTQPHGRQTISNFGSRVDCCAWGENMVTAGNSATPTKKDAYQTDFGGTSGASAIIAGVALLFQELRTKLTPKSGAGKASPATMRRVLANAANCTAVATAEPIGHMPDFARIIANEFTP